MKAIVVESPGTYCMKEVPRPVVSRPDDVVVQVKAVGICGSDLHLLHGLNSAAHYPRIPGHEIVGEVVEVGSAVTEWKHGDRVIAEPLRYCGKCHACRRGRRNVCQHLQIVSVDIDGGFAEYYVSPDQNLYALPDWISWELATAIEPCTIGEQAHARAGTLPDDIVLIHGAGPIGLMVLDTAKRIGARAIISEVSAARRELALDFGADAVIDPQNEDLRKRVEDLTDGIGPNEIFDSAGVPELLPLSIEIAATAGAIVPMSFNERPIPIRCAPINRKELTISGTRHQYKMFPKVIEHLAEREAMLQKYVTHIFSFDQFEQAISIASNPESGACKVVMHF